MAKTNTSAVTLHLCFCAGLAMVGYDENVSKRITDTEYAAAGAAAGSLTRCISQPLDVIKIRFQVSFSKLNTLSLIDSIRNPMII